MEHLESRRTTGVPSGSHATRVNVQAKLKVAAALLDATLSATDLVIASPVYWYSLSASAKLYLDYWSGWMRLPGVDFKKRMAAKTLWAVCALSDDESTAGAQPLIETLRLTAEYMEMRWGGVLLGYGNRPGDVLNHTDSLERAALFFSAESSSTSVPL